MHVVSKKNIRLYLRKYISISLNDKTLFHYIRILTTPLFYGPSTIKINTSPCTNNHDKQPSLGKKVNHYFASQKPTLEFLVRTSQRNPPYE